MAVKILVMGLPGAGKTSLSVELVKQLRTMDKTVDFLNADNVREQYNDWDFSESGRIRQAVRMRKLSEDSTSEYVISDFICPLPQTREIYSADFMIWVNTKETGRFEDTNNIFVPPEKFDICVITQDVNYWVNIILKRLMVSV